MKKKLTGLCSCGCGRTITYKPLSPSELKLRGPKRYHKGHHPRKPRVITDEERAEWSLRNRGPGNGRWKGGRRKSMDGYIQLWMPDHPNARKDGTFLEHRLVMEDRLGRLLDSDEIVHHISGDVSDNRPENLELHTHVSHQRRERLGNHFPRVRIQFKCEHCGTTFLKTLSRAKRNPRFCSRACFYGSHRTS